MSRTGGALCGENICHCFFNVFHSLEPCMRVRRHSHTCSTDLYTHTHAWSHVCVCVCVCVRHIHPISYDDGENALSRSAGFISIVFQANKRERSHLLPSPCQDSRSLLNYGWISPLGVCKRAAVVRDFSILQARLTVGPFSR